MSMAEKKIEFHTVNNLQYVLYKQTCSILGQWLWKLIHDLVPSPEKVFQKETQNPCFGNH